MAYKASPLNTSAVIYMIILAVYTSVNYKGLSSGEGWGVVFMFYFFRFGVVAFLLDLVLQLLIKNREIHNIISVILTLVFITMAVMIFMDF